jgi:hypothetical protein
MKKLFLSVLFIPSFLLSSGCVGVAPFTPPQGMIYNNVTAPLDLDYNKTALGNKSGTASAHNILGLFAFGNISTQAAAANGGLSTINHADYASFNLLSLPSHSSFPKLYGAILKKC